MSIFKFLDDDIRNQKNLSLSAQINPSKGPPEHGLLLSVYHEDSGAMLLRRTFPTYGYFSYGFDVIWWLKRLQKGRIAVITIKGGGIVGLFSVRNELENLGSVFISSIPQFCHWIWIFMVGGVTLLETFSLEISPLKVHSTIHHRSPAMLNQTNTYESVNQKLCSRLESLGTYCDPDLYNKLLQRIKLKKHSNQNPKIGIIIFTGVRPQYLIETIESSFKCKEVFGSDIIATVGTSFQTKQVNEDIITILTDIGIEYRIVESFTKSNNSSKYVESFHYYSKSISIAAESFKNFDFIVFLDEDVIVSPDWMHMLSYAAPILNTDTSLWCISPSSGARVQGGDPKKLIRGLKQPGYGFLMSLALIIEILPSMNPGEEALHDLWLMNFMNDRECIFPEIGRSQHFGIGINTIPEVHQLYSIDANLYHGPYVPFTKLVDLEKHKYSNQIIYELQHGKAYNKNPCKPGFFETEPSIVDSVFVFAYALHEDQLLPYWANLAECLGLYPHSIKNMHNFTVPLSLPNGNVVWLVGVPHSSFSPYVLEDVPVWDYKKDLDENPPILLPNYSNYTYDNIVNDIFY